MHSIRKNRLAWIGSFSGIGIAGGRGGRAASVAVVSACQSAAATTAETLRWLGLNDPAAELEAQAAREATAAPVGVARALVAELRCAVVAMRYPVLDDFAVGFADAFYDRVLRLDQAFDKAVAASVPAVLGPKPSPARPAILVATPVLFG